MKFPTATVILVSSALAFVLWSQTREQPAPMDVSRLADLEAQPVERGQVVDWLTERVPEFCEEAVGATEGSEYDDCLDTSEAREPTCRRAMADRFPGMIGSEQTFRDLSVTLMNCLVQHSRLLTD